MLGRSGDPVENYRSVDEAARRLRRRSDSERQRFLSRYGVDKTLLRNYDLIFDTTSAMPEDVVARIVESIEASAGSLPAPPCYLDPSRVRRAATMNGDGEIVVRYQPPRLLRCPRPPAAGCRRTRR